MNLQKHHTLTLTDLQLYIYTNLNRGLYAREQFLIVDALQTRAYATNLSITLKTLSSI